MRQLSAFIEEPNALDVFAYRGFLFVLTFDGRILQYNVEQLARDMRAEDEEAGLVVAYGLFSSKGIGASPEMKGAWKAFDHASSRTVKIRSLPVVTSRFIVEASAHLDMRIFYNQLFLATDVGTFRAPLGTTGSLLDEGAEVERLLSEPTVALSTGLGAVGASLGDEGLVVFTDVGARERQPAIRVEVRSLRSSIGWGSAVNHPTHDSYEVLPSKVATDNSGRKKLVGLSSPPTGDTDHRTTEGSYAVWESGRLLLGSNTGVASFGRFNGRSRHLSYSTDRESVLWLGATGNRCIVMETSERISAVRGDESIVLYEGQAASVRTFGGSQRYKRLIASTVDGGLLLSAVFASEN